MITPITPKGLDTAIPEQPPPGEQQLPQPETVVLSLDRDGILRINQEVVEPARLMPRLLEIFKTRNDRTIFVHADNSLLFADVARLIDTAKGAGIGRVGLLTGQISNP